MLREVIRRIVARALGLGYPPTLVASAGGPSRAGEMITLETGLACSAVWACVRIIADAVASLPLHLYRRRPDGARERAVDHPLYRVLHDRANPAMSALQLRHTMQMWLLLRGNAYARIVRDSAGRTIALWPLAPDKVDLRENGDGTITYTVNREPAPPGSIFHLRGPSLDGYRGLSLITIARHGFGLALAQEAYASAYYRHGGRRQFYLRKLSRFPSRDALEEFRRSFAEAYQQSATYHTPMILEGDLELHELGLSFEDAQFLASRQFQVAEICRWFLVPPHKVGQLERATYANAEQTDREFKQVTLLFWLSQWEASIEQQLIEPGGPYYAEHDTAGFERADYAARTAGYQRLLSYGILSPNEVRRLENLEPYEGGDRRWMPANLMPVGGS